MSVASEGFPNEETRRFHVALAQRSLGQISVTEALQQGLRFEHGSYGAVLQDESMEEIRRQIAQESRDEQREAVREIIDERRRNRLEAQEARRVADDKEWGWSQQAAAHDPLPQGLFTGAASRVLAGGDLSAGGADSAETPDTYEASAERPTPGVALEISEQTKKELIDAGGPLMELELGKLAADGVIRIESDASTSE